MNGLPYEIYAVLGALVVVAGFIEARWKVVRCWWIVRRTIRGIILGVPAVVVNGIEIRKAEPSLPARLNANDAKVDDLIAHTRSSNGTLARMASVMDVHVANSEVHHKDETVEQTRHAHATEDI